MPSRSLITMMIVIFSTLLAGSIMFQYITKPSKMHRTHYRDIKQITLPKPHYPSRISNKGLTISSTPTYLNLIHRNIDERLETHHRSRNISQQHHYKEPPKLPEMTVSKAHAHMIPSYKMHSSRQSPQHNSRPKKKVV